jgi:hypothetical protein
MGFAMAKKAKKRLTRKAAKSKKTRTARRIRTSARTRAPKKKAATRKARSVPRAKAKRKATRRAATPANKAATRVTAKLVRQRATSTRPIRHLVDDDEPRERMDAETTLLGSRDGVETDDLAEELGEAFVTTATSGEQADEDIRDQEVPEERGGPFVVTTAREEFASGTDASNPPGAERAPRPTTSSDDSD